MKKRNIAMLVGLIALFVVAGVLVVVGVTTHTEAGLMEDWQSWDRDDFPLTYCLGLAHDDFKSSIMRRTQSSSSTPMGAWPPRITDHDRDLLRERYAP